MRAASLSSFPSLLPLWLAATLVAGPLSGCGDDTSGDDDDDVVGMGDDDDDDQPDGGVDPMGDDDDDDTGSADVSPSTTVIEFFHQAGVTECPQDINMGPVTLTNEGDADGSFSVGATSGALTVAPRSGTVPAGGTADLTFLFTCMVPGIPFDLDETVSISVDGSTSGIQVQVIGDID